MHVQGDVSSRGGSNITGILQKKPTATPFLCSAQSPPGIMINVLGQVVRRLIDANPGLNVNQSIILRA